MFSKIKLLQLAIAVFGAALVLCTVASAAETDQFYDRAKPIADSTEILNKKVNETIAEIVAGRRNEPRQKVIVNAVYRTLGGPRMTDKLEKWLIESPQVEKREVARRDSIYGGMPIWTTRFAFIFGLGKTLSVNDQLIGSDKISHFLSQGWKFHKRYQRTGSEEAAAKRAVLTERAIFGAGTTGTFSNADLVANFEGYRFYRSLFEDDVIPGKPAILRWEDGGWVVQREFDWADHVNEYWDEALNVNSYDVLLRRRMQRRFVSSCPQYWQDPAIYEIENEEKLRSRYAHLGMRDTRDSRLDTLCLAHLPESGDMMVAAIDRPL